MTISKKDCVIVYREITRNSNRKWRTGLVLGKHKDYGMAISAMVISIEELVKALIIALDASGFEFRKSKGIKLFFNNHEIRFFIAYFTFIISLVADELTKFFTLLHENKFDIHQLEREVRDDFAAFSKKHKIWGLRKLVQLKKELTWFENIETLRQNGFYCDYKSNFHTPLAITASDYNEALLRFQKARYVLRRLSFEVTHEKFRNNENMRRLRREFKKNNYYAAIGDLLTSLSEQKIGSFTLLRNNIHELI